jgi:hypothetical protein
VAFSRKETERNKISLLLFIIIPSLLSYSAGKRVPLFLLTIGEFVYPLLYLNWRSTQIFMEAEFHGQNAKAVVGSDC